MRSRLVDDKQRFPENIMWLGWGRRDPDTRKLLDFVPCLNVGIFGGFALLVSVMIMILDPTKLTALVTTCICVLFVAIALAITMYETLPKDVS